uniref:Methyltransferase (HUSSY homologue), putative n=1 Tax=Theileria annulata TaxID=5874 RepID=A0A3B0MSP5_THEAN
MSTRPEHSAPPEIFYSAEESRKYNTNSRISKIQTEMSERALEMLLLPEDQTSLVLDIGCGTGISGNVISNSNNFWIGLDISHHMLNECLLNDVEGEVVLCDIGENMNFLPNMFDGCISISVLQWLFISNNKSQDPYRRLCCFFKFVDQFLYNHQWLYKSLAYNARACLQFYPENAEQVDMLLDIVRKCNFNGGLVVDNPNSAKAKKYYLCIWSHSSNIYHNLPKPIDEEAQVDEEEDFVNKNVKKRHKNKLSYKDKIIKKKQQQRNKVILSHYYSIIHYNVNVLGTAYKT